MLALGYDAGLRRQEELCSLRTDDLDPGHRLLRIRAETTKGRRDAWRHIRLWVVSCCVCTSRIEPEISRARGPLFLSESPGATTRSR